MVRLPYRLQLSALVLVAAQLLMACAGKLDEKRVREFVDSADQAFLKGNATRVCAMRAENFRLEATSFELAKGKTVRSLAEAESVEADSPSAPASPGKAEVLDLQKFCFMALESKNFYKRATLERGDLNIQVDPSGRRATVRAHYTVKEPVYEYGESTLHDNDRVEHQVATRQTESDDESVIVMGPDGDPLFESTRSSSKSFLIARELDRRL
jgi:hypothetical protein